MENVVNILVRRTVKIKADEAVTLLHDVRDLTGQHSPAEHHTVTNASALAGLNEALPGVGGALPQKQQLNARLLSALGVSVQARGDDLGVVDHQDILGADIIDNIVKMLVL